MSVLQIFQTKARRVLTEGNDCVSVRDTEEQHGEDREDVLGRRLSG